MKALMTLGHCYLRCEGKYWAKSTLGYDPFLKEYLNVFDHLDVISRVADCDTVEPLYKPVEGDGVTLRPVPNYDGIIGFLKKIFIVSKECRKAVKDCDLIFMRVPGELSVLCWFWAMIYRKKYGTTLTIEGFKAIKERPLNRHTILLKCAAFLNELVIRLQIKGAVACSYVGRKLVVLYPPTKNVGTWFFSTVQIKEEDFGKCREFPTEGFFNIITTANLIRHKGNHYVLEALAMLKERGYTNWSYTLLGEGPERQALEEQAKKLGIDDRVTLPGYITSRKQLYEYLDNADIFLYGSLVEGLPRVVIEACSRGLPVVSSDATCVGELIDPQWLVDCHDSKGLAEAMIAMMSNKDAYEMASKNNIQQAKSFIDYKLLKEKLEFMNAVKSSLKTDL